MFVSSVLLLQLTLVCSLGVSGQIPGQPRTMPRSQTYQGRDTDGTYSFGYTVHEPSGTTKFRQESGDGAGNRQGSYGLEEKDSQRIVFNYATKPKSSTQFIDHPAPLSTQQRDQGPPTPLITPSQSTVSASPSGPRGRDGPMDGSSSVDVGFGPSFEPRGQEMDDDSRFNNPAFDDFDFDGRSEFGGEEPKMRQSSNTNWDGSESMGGGRNGEVGGDHGPWNKAIIGGEHNGHHPHRAHPSNAEPGHHNPHSSPNHPHQPNHKRGGEDVFGTNESSEMTNEPANYEQLVAYLANQQRPAGQSRALLPRSPMRPQDFAFKSR